MGIEVTYRRNGPSRTISFSGLLYGIATKPAGGDVVWTCPRGCVRSAEDVGAAVVAVFCHAFDLDRVSLEMETDLAKAIERERATL